SQKGGQKAIQSMEESLEKVDQLYDQGHHLQARALLHFPFHQKTNKEPGGHAPAKRADENLQVDFQGFQI
ncbi:MAG: hypothetical protein AAFV25_15150, partial [Bacteroidota bacterium]